MRASACFEGLQRIINNAVLPLTLKTQLIPQQVYRITDAGAADSLLVVISKLNSGKMVFATFKPTVSILCIMSNVQITLHVINT